MAITTEPTPLFSHVFFVPSGTSFTSPSSGTASATAKPGASDTSWTDGALGDVEEFTTTPEAETVEKMAGRPGTLVMVDQIELSKKITIKFKTQDRSPRAEQLLDGTLALTGSSTQGNPLEGSLLVKGWLKVQQYSGGTLKVTKDYWVSARVTSVDPDSGRNLHQLEITAEVLHSTLNTIAYAA